MKNFVWLIAIITIVAGGCKNQELEKQKQQLQLQNNELTQELATRDEYVERVTHSINEVYANIEGARARESILMRETEQMEGAKKRTSLEVREQLLAHIAAIDSNLANNRQRLDSLQAKLSSYKNQFAGLKKIIFTLKQSLLEREQAIADLNLRVQGLEAEVGEKTRLVAERDSVIGTQYTLIGEQHRQIVTGFYVIGTRRELESKGIIKDEGGFLWGMLGSTTNLSNGFDSKHFLPLHKFVDTTITIDGEIDEIVPKRNVKFYSQTILAGKKTRITILDPIGFWQDDYLVIIKD